MTDCPHPEPCGAEGPDTREKERENMGYRERQEAKADRLAEWAAKRAEKAEASLTQARAMGEAIPLGQPILVGHHSERADRRYRGRIDSTYRKAFEHGQKAESMAARSAGITAQLDRSIYSDDHDAIDRLNERIAELEAERDRVKAYNASCRQAAKSGGTGDLSLLDDRQRADILSTAKVCPYQIGPGGAFPAYHLSNLSGNIKRYRDRLAEVERRQEKTARTEEAGGVLVETVGGGRYARVTFTEKPGRDVIVALKAAGFRWGSGSWTGDVDKVPAEVRNIKRA